MWLDALAIPLLDRLLLGALRAVKRNSDVQVTLCLLTSLGIVAGRCAASKLQRGYYFELAEQRQPGGNDDLISDDNCLDNDCSKLWHAGSPSLLYRDSSVEISALARTMYNSLYPDPVQETTELAL
ncbi:hypothetical protein Acr_27g0001680 [Actinidia rufa]|uniref:Uncharacterized protein n=1 Tax=Actinidia rufa TaxID=165716 RepID=A0A7J0H5U7_9ERIC|nr:hypothetical protein Acr_27g0001680 [Actinidia rufa]